MNNSQIPIIIGLDEAYLLPATVTVYSLLKNNPNAAFKIYIFIGEENSTWLEPLINLINRMGSTAIIKSLTLESNINLKINRHFSLATYLRIFAPAMIDESRVIYLDSDVLIIGDLSDLWKTSIGEFPVAAVRDFVIDDYHRLNLSPQMGYFNSGVMIMQFEEWKKLDLTNSILAYLEENPQRIEYADQCAINAVLQGNWFPLPPKWNIQTYDQKKIPSLKSKEYFSLQEWEEIQLSPKIIHFTGLPKPWNLGGNNPYRSLYWKYLRETPLSRKFPLNLSFLNLLKSSIPFNIKKMYWGFLSRKKTK